jgi:hypothetical protein
VSITTILFLKYAICERRVLFLFECVRSGETYHLFAKENKLGSSCNFVILPRFKCASMEKVGQKWGKSEKKAIFP